MRSYEVARIDTTQTAPNVSEVKFSDSVILVESKEAQPGTSERGARNSDLNSLLSQQTKPVQGILKSKNSSRSPDRYQNTTNLGSPSGTALAAAAYSLKDVSRSKTLYGIKKHRKDPSIDEALMNPVKRNFNNLRQSDATATSLTTPDIASLKRSSQPPNRELDAKNAGHRSGSLRGGGNT